MTTEETLEELWTSPAHRPSPARVEQLAARFVRRARWRRWHERVRLGWGLLMLSATTIFAIWLIVGPERVNVVEQWSLIPTLVVPWVFAIWLVRHSLASARPSLDMPILHGLSVAMAACEASLKRARILALLLLPSTLALAAAIGQLYGSGRITPQQLAGMAGFMASMLLIFAGALAANYFGRLRPEHDQLARLLGNYSGRATDQATREAK
ncbi:hypothetical protein ACNOYE_18380 [Nannocystaceae bacterium ST9]